MIEPLHPSPGGTAPPTVTRPFDAVVFDCDGVLADTSAAWQYSFDRAGAMLGIELTLEQHRQLTGSSTATAAATIAAWTDQPCDVDAIRHRIDAALRTAIAEHPIQPLPGVEALLQRLFGRVPLAVASNAPADVLVGVLTATGLLSSFTTIISADDVANPKPAPDVYLAACAALGVKPAAAAAIEDSATGARAANRAGMALVIVTAQPWWPPSVHVASLTDPAVAEHLLDRGRAPSTNAGFSATWTADHR